VSGPRLAVLGAGRMGQAIMSGLLSSGWVPERIVAAEAHAPTADLVRERLGISVAPGPEAVEDADAVLVAVKPHHVAGVLDEVADRLRPGVTVVCIAAGVTTATVAAHVPEGTAIVRVMPNTPALVGQGMSALSPMPGCPRESVELARSILASVGAVAEVPESLQDAVTALSGSGPAYVFHLAESMIDAGVLLGLPRPLAHTLTVQTLVGAATMLRDSGEHPAVLRENVTSPGGTTAAALHVLEDAAVRAAMANAMRAARDRSAELGSD
jgi:pyrroline-5-carboxylate reductase